MPPKRIEVIQSIMSTIDDEIIVSSCGMISREVYHVKDRPENFYLMGSMGSTVAVSIGIGLNVDRDVIVIAGDGDVLMDLGSLVLLRKLELENIMVHILDNGCYSSTGGQKTISDSVRLDNFADWITVHKVSSEKGDAPRIPLTLEQIKFRFMKAIESE